jgi:phage-related protein
LHSECIIDGSIRRLESRHEAATAGTRISLLIAGFSAHLSPVPGGVKSLVGLYQNLYTSMPNARRPLVWIGRSKKDFGRFPDEVQESLTIALELAREGAREIRGAKPLSHGLLKGFGVVELIEDFDGDTYRAVYTTKIGAVLAVLHAFKKKSKSGIATPRHEIELIRDRYRAAVRRFSKPSERR